MKKSYLYTLLAILTVIVLVKVNMDNNRARSLSIDDNLINISNQKIPTITKVWNDMSIWRWTISTTEKYTVRRSLPSLIANSEILDPNGNIISYTRWSHLLS